MRGLTRFEHGERVTIRGAHYEFHALIPPVSPRPDGSFDLQFLDVRTRRAENFTPQQYLAAYVAGEVVYHRSPMQPGDAPGEDEDPSRQIARQWRLYWTTTFDKFPTAKSTKKLQAFIDAHKDNQPVPVKPPSPHTLRTWLRTRGRPDDRRARQMGDRRRQTSPRRDLHPVVLEAWETASQRYWSNYRYTFESFQNDVRAQLFEANQRRTEEGKKPVHIPSRTTLHRWLMKERTYANVALKEGKYIADRMFKGIRDSLAAKRILDVAIIDHKRMDVYVVDPVSGIVIGRPWLAVLLDVKSRMVLGHTLSFEDPSVLSVMACIRACLRGRPDLKVKFPIIEGDWEAFGVPRTILADNAWENTGSSLLDACTDFGISIEWAPVRSPEYKGILERFFSRLDDQLAHFLPGSITDKPHVLATARIDPQVDAAISLEKLDEFLCQYMVDVYPWDRHEGIDGIPLKVWRDSAVQDGIELAHNLADVDHAMGTLIRGRTLSREGVTFKGLVYRSADVDGLLADLIRLQPASLRRGTAEVKIKYHPEDLSRIFVWNELRGHYVGLPCTQPIYAAGLSERVHTEVEQQRAQMDSAFVSEEERCRRKAALMRNVQDSYPQQSVAERRRRARLLENPAHSSRIPEPPNSKVDALSTRLDGDKPEKASVRSRKAEKASPKPVAAPSVATQTEVLDPFAGRDRRATVLKAMERLS